VGRAVFIKGRAGVSSDCAWRTILSGCCGGSALEKIPNPLTLYEDDRGSDKCKITTMHTTFNTTRMILLCVHDESGELCASGADTTE
jgi:hypothetical protein